MKKHGTKNRRNSRAKNIKTLIEKGKKRDNYIDKVLAKCKSRGGPFVCIKEMKAVLDGKSDDDQRKILRHKITFHTHPNDALEMKEMYLINRQKVSTMIYNLEIILLSDRMQEDTDGEIFLPTDVLTIIRIWSVTEGTTVLQVLFAETLIIQGNQVLAVMNCVPLSGTIKEN